MRDVFPPDRLAIVVTLALEHTLLSLRRPICQPRRADEDDLGQRAGECSEDHRTLMKTRVRREMHLVTSRDRGPSCTHFEMWSIASRFVLLVMVDLPVHQRLLTPTLPQSALSVFAIVDPKR
jgi:hypothetical protein